MPPCFFETSLGLFSSEIMFPQSRGPVSSCCLLKAITKRVKRNKQKTEQMTFSFELVTVRVTL